MDHHKTKEEVNSDTDYEVEVMTTEVAADKTKEVANPDDNYEVEDTTAEAEAEFDEMEVTSVMEQDKTKEVNPDDNEYEVDTTAEAEEEDDQSMLKRRSSTTAGRTASENGNGNVNGNGNGNSTFTTTVDSSSASSSPGKESPSWVTEIDTSSKNDNNVMQVEVDQPAVGGVEEANGDDADDDYEVKDLEEDEKEEYEISGVPPQQAEEVVEQNNSVQLYSKSEDRSAVAGYSASKGGNDNLNSIII